MSKTKIVIIGAGPAGLTAAFELSKFGENYDIIVIETEGQVGGISKTINYKGNKLDIGGHRFFSKSSVVLKWWSDILPVYYNKDTNLSISYQGKSEILNPENFSSTKNSDEDVILIRSRSSHILFQGKLFRYPLKLNIQTIRKLGVKNILPIGISFIKRKIKPLKEEKNLEQFLINRFGNKLYKTFFKSYTEKVWGKKCNEISAEWGAQRIKNLDFFEIIIDFFVKKITGKKSLINKKTQTSLIEYFLYPRKGPGHLWEKVEDILIERGVKVYKNSYFKNLSIADNKVCSFQFENKNKELIASDCDYFISTIPIKHLLRKIEYGVPNEVLAISNSLEYRDFITVGLLVGSFFGYSTQNIPNKDNWIYIQENNVKVGRIQIFNHWSEDMVADKTKFWIGLEYFCNKTDYLWQMSEEELVELAKKELEILKICNFNEIFDGTVIKVPKAYPAYWGAYHQFDKIKNYTDSIENLFLIGRNGMHRYNNQDHSMLTAMEAVKNIQNNIKTKDNIWEVNTEMEYLEKK